MDGSNVNGNGIDEGTIYEYTPGRVPKSNYEVFRVIPINL